MRQTSPSSLPLKERDGPSPTKQASRLRSRQSDAYWVYPQPAVKQECPDRGTVCRGKLTHQGKRCQRLEPNGPRCGSPCRGCTRRRGRTQGRKTSTSFPWRTSCRVSRQHPSAQAKSSGRKPNTKAVVSAMPIVSAEARATITDIMAIPFFSYVGVARTGRGLP
jgi:hypothetical protein